MRVKHRPGPPSFRSDLNVTPLVDVTLVLLIIFMVVTPLIRSHGGVELPRARSGEATPAHPPLTVTVESDRTLRVDRQVVTLAQLRQRLELAFRDHRDAELTVHGDRRLKVRDVHAVLRTATEAGITRLNVGSTPEAER